MERNSGTVGESRRVVHMFPIRAEETTSERLTAYCGEAFGPSELELLECLVGMPCVTCLHRAPIPGKCGTAGDRAMASGPRPIMPAFQRELDPLLLLPVRLFIACLLADMRWCEDVAVQSVLRLSEWKLAPHVERLRAAGFLEARAEGRRVKVRLTLLGLDRLTEHVKALDRVANTAAEIVAEALLAPARPKDSAHRAARQRTST